MKTDVKLLIDALTTERNAIDRAIGSLKAMSEITGTAKPAAKLTETPKPRRKAKTFLSDDTKRDIIAEMSLATHQLNTAKRLARIHGGSPMTILTTWRVWQRALAPKSNGADYTENITSPPVAEFTPTV